MPALDESKPLGLILTLPGAPVTPHTIVGVRGLYRSDVPTPIGGSGELTLEEAKTAIDNGAPVALVNIAAKDVDAVRAQVEADISAARTGAIAARQDGPVGAEAGVLSDQLDAVKD
jgi:hypothetical protein